MLRGPGLRLDDFHNSPYISSLILLRQDLLMALENILIRFPRTILKPLKWYQETTTAVEQSCCRKLTDIDTFPGQLHIQPLLQRNSRNDQTFNPDFLLPRVCDARLPKNRPSDHNLHRIMGSDHHHCFGS